MSEKWPREYAGEIIKLKTKQQRIEAIKKVPENYKELVIKHVENHFEKRAFKKGL